jgi:DNA repair exonuclease SbcCD ATPase subunit
MIILKSLHLQDFLSHKDTELYFQPSEKVLFSGASGSGKSSLASDSIFFCLFGRGRSDSTKNLIRKGAKKAVVSLTLTDTELHKDWIVKRSISDAKHELNLFEQKEGGEKPIQVKTLGIRESQSYLQDKILHSSAELFCNSVLFPQSGESSFVNLPASQRKELLLEIIGNQNFEELLEKAKVLIKENKLKLSGLDSLIVEKKKQISSNELSSKDLSQYQERQFVLQKELETLNVQESEIRVKLSEITKKKVESEAKKKELNGYLSEYDTKSAKIDFLNIELRELSKKEDIVLPGIEEINSKKKQVAEYDRVRESINKWNSDQKDIILKTPITSYCDDRIKSLTAKMSEAFQMPEEKCPSCGFVLSDIKQKSISSLSAELMAEQKKLNEIRAEIEKCKAESLALGDCPKQLLSEEELNAISSELDAFEKNREKIQQQEVNKAKMAGVAKELMVASSEKKALGEKIEKLMAEKTVDYDSVEKEANEKMRILGEEKRRLNVEMENNTSLLAVAKYAAEQLGANSIELEKALGESVKVREDLECLELIKEAMGDKGLPCLLIDYFIPRLQEEINNTLSEFSDFRVILDTQKENAKGNSVIETLSICIKNDVGEIMDIENFSGGERQKIIFSIFDGFGKFTKINFRILDESFIALDQESLEKFGEIVVKMKEGNGQLAVISHEETIKEMFEQRIEVKKINGVSSIEK